MLDRRPSLSSLLLLGWVAPLAAQEASSPPAAEPSARVVQLVRPSGVYADLPEVGFDVTTLMLGGSPQAVQPFYELVDRLEELRGAPAETPVLLDLTRPLGLNLPQLAELERVMRELRASGKRCIAYLENATRTQYALAAQCDEILMADMGVLDLPSLAMSSSYFKDALDMLGIQMDVIRCGDFKGAAEPFMLSRMSAHLRKHYEEMLARMNDDVVRQIAAGRGLRAEVVRELQGERILPAQRALAAGLVDRLVPWQGARAALAAHIGDAKVELQDVLRKKRGKASFNPMAMLQTLFKPPQEEEVEAQTLAVLHLAGPIVDGYRAIPGSIVSDPTVEAIRALAENDKIRGVVVRINSPGGSATASEAVMLALRELAQRKPVVCSMGSVAASGGYYVTCFGRPILAEAGTITGSIGVLGVKPNLGPLMRRVGFHTELIALDESAALDAVDQGWSEHDRARMQQLVDDIYGRFLDHVAASRQRPREQIEKVAGGRVWSGVQAVELGLVDRVGGLDEALAMVAKEAGIETYEVVHRPRAKSFLDLITEELMQIRALLPQPLPAALRQHAASLRVPLAMLLDALHGETPARVWAVMPAELSIR